MNQESCKRCMEPTTEEQRENQRLAVSSAPSSSSSSSSAAAAAAPPSAARVRAPPRAARARAQPAASRTIAATSATTSASSSRPKKTTKKGNSKAKVHTLPKKKSATIRRKPQERFHKGDLGYKPKKGGNINSFVRSRLNHATVSYAAKFAKDDGSDGKRKKSGNIHTIGSGTVNGFVAPSVKRTNAATAHDMTAAPRPAKYSMGGRSMKVSGKCGAKPGGGGLLGFLQSVSAQEAVASLKHTKRTVSKQTKDLGNGARSSLAL
jgi:hypothetical protein